MPHPVHCTVHTPDKNSGYPGTSTETSGHSNLTKAASPLLVDGSVIFARWRQCASHLMHASLDPPYSTSLMASRLVALAGFAQLTAENPYTLQWATHFLLQNCHSMGDLESCLMHASLDPLELTTHMASESVQPFSHSLRQRALLHFPSKLFLPVGRSGPSCNTSVFARLTIVMDIPCYSVFNNRL